MHNTYNIINTKMQTITINGLKYRKHINTNGEAEYKLDNIM
jgi:hypothetical protein